ncbi:MAG: ACT domain-containing protein [Blastocatellia bacterium]|nr:ACT domain-containing protein [Blastocatellia bacterium]MBN8722733.1 ACT domain-containing protein [Acidobacteriota bacterium]
MTRILLADKLHSSCISALQQINSLEVVNKPDLSADTLPEALEGIDILVVRSTKVTTKALEAAKSLSLIIRAGAGTNTIDVKGASRRGIYVTNCPGKNAAAVAELALGLMLAIDRRIPDNVIEMRQGKWNKKKFSKANGLKGRTLGIIGLGQIGQDVITRSQSFGMEVIGWSRSLTPEKAEELNIKFAATPLEVAASADIVSVHLALADGTKNLINREFLAAMKKGAIFINTSRGEVVDEEALAEELAAGRLFAGLDVFAQEPAGGEAQISFPISTSANLYGTHHIGASTDQAESETGDEVVRIVKCFLNGEEIPNCVNLRRGSSASYGIVVRHEDRVGVLAAVFGVLKEHGCNVQEMQNQIFEGAVAACAKIMLDAPAPQEALNLIKECDGVLYVATVG